MSGHKFIADCDIQKLKPYERNPRRNDDAVQAVANSIKSFGFNAPIIVNNSFRICVGHTRYKAALQLHLKKVPVLMVKGLTGKKFTGYNIADNQTGTIAEWDEAELAAIVQELQGQDFNLADLGFNEKELIAVLKGADEDYEGLSDPDDVPDLPKKAICRRGDIWQLGRHRLMCGDATSEGDMASLMQNHKADIVITDPPYNIGFKYYLYDDNKSKDEYQSFCEQWFNILSNYAKCIVITPGNQNMAMWYDITNIKEYGTWLKKNTMSGGSIFHLRITEPILFIGKFNARRPNDVFEHFVWSGFLREQAEATTLQMHSCPKPIPLIQDIIESFSNKNDIVLDVFIGSGTCIIACEKVHRICYGMEIDPKYCDVTIERWQNFTGQKAKRLNHRRRKAA